MTVTTYAKPVFRVGDYGAVGNGKTNDIGAFQRLAKDVNKAEGGTVLFDAGKTYLIAVKDDPNGGHTANAIPEAMAFNFENCVGITVNMNGATIKLAKTNSSKYTIFRFFNCTDFILQNGVLEGDATAHDYSHVTWRGKTAESTHEWGMGVVINGSKGTVRNMEILHMTGDAIYSGNFKTNGKVYSAKVLFKNLELHHCRKNGVGCLSSEGTTFENCHIHHIGTWDGITGTAPQTGIDFEYEDGTDASGDIKLTNCHIHHCTRRAIIASNGAAAPHPNNFAMEGCTIEGACHLANMQAKNTATICDSKFTSTFFFGDVNVKNCSFEMPADACYINETKFTNCQFKGVLNGFDKDPHGCCFSGYNGKPTTFSECTFRDIRGTNVNLVSQQGFSGFAFPMNITFVRCKFYNVTFGRGKSDVKSSFKFDRCELSEDCSFYSNDNASTIVFNKCMLKEVSAGTKKTGKYEFNGCKIYQGREPNPVLKSGQRKMKKSKIIVQ